MMKKIAERVVSMQKTKKEKKRLTPNKTSEDALDLIFNEIKGIIDDDATVNNYQFFLTTIAELLEHVKNTPWPDKASDFIQEFYYPYDEISAVNRYMLFREPYRMYCKMTRAYYVLTNPLGKKVFQQLLEWYPFAEGKQILSTWPDNYLISQFRPTKLENRVYFEDIRTQKKYPIMVDEKDQENFFSNLPSLFITMLVPAKDGYILDILLANEPFDLISSTIIEQMDKQQWEEYLMHWFRKNLLELVTKLYSSCNDRPTPEFYSAHQLKGETKENFANRLIEQDNSLRRFPQRQLLNEFFVKIIHAFPRLFAAQVNVMPLLEAVKQLFDDIDLNAELQFKDHPTDFWLYLILTTLPEEAAKFKNYRL